MSMPCPVNRAVRVAGPTPRPSSASRTDWRCFWASVTGGTVPVTAAAPAAVTSSR